MVSLRTAEDLDVAFVAYGDMGSTDITGIELTPGAPANLSSVVSFDGGFSGDTIYSGVFTFTSSNTPFPCSDNGCVANAPFSFAGNLIARGFDGVTLWQRSLVGSGTAEGHWFAQAQLVNYTFAADPVPEPSTLMLVGLTLTAAGVRRLRSTAESRSR